MLGAMPLGVNVQNQGEARALLQRCQRLWGQEYVPPIFALLLHLFLLKVGNAVALSWQLMNIFVQGAEKVFALDIRSGTVCPFPLLALERQAFCPISLSTTKLHRSHCAYLYNRWIFFDAARI